MKLKENTEQNLISEDIGHSSGIEKFFAREGVDPLESAFDSDAGPHPGAGGDKVPTEDLSDVWDIATSSVDSSNRRALYVHVPFCKSRCTFCPFYTYQSKDDELAKYANALLQEIELISDLPAVAGHPIHSVYFGGGTPTDLSARDLNRLISTIRDKFPLANDCEITIEGRITGFTLEKKRACIEAGANRFSIGVQTFDTKIRRGVGRKADTTEILSSLDELCAIDNAAIVVDLIYGLPGQTIETWENDINTLINKTGVHGVDLYKLKLVPGSLLTEAGKPVEGPDNKQKGLFFKRGSEIVADHGFRRLSNCHWSRGTRERNRYNTDTAFRATCIPIGSSAGGRVGDYMFFQESDIVRYYESVKAGKKPIQTATKLPEHSDIRDEIAGQVSLGVIFPDLIQTPPGTSKYNLYQLLAQWERSGLVVFTSSAKVELTIAGQFWSNKIARSLIECAGAG